MEMITGSGHSAKGTADAYLALVDSAFPFAVKTRGDTDKKMVEAMQKETAKGPISFSPISTPNPLVQAARKMRLPDSFREKLQAGAAARKRTK